MLSYTLNSDGFSMNAEGDCSEVAKTKFCKKHPNSIACPKVKKCLKEKKKNEQKATNMAMAEKETVAVAPESERAISMTTVAIGGVGLLLLVGVAAFFIIRKNNNDTV